MIFLTQRSNPRSMANLTARLIFVVFTLLIIMLLSFSYQFTSSAVTQEVERNLTQTEALLQNMLDYKLETMQTSQNSQAKSMTLHQYVQENVKAQIDDYFLSVDQANLKDSPDFRFITKGQTLYWDDDNSPFFGIVQTDLMTLIKDIAYNESWHFEVLDIDIGQRNLLVRRMPMINDSTGEVLGKLYIALVLDNNFSLVENLKTVSNSKEVVLLAEDKPVASTVKLDRELLIRIHESKKPEFAYNNDWLFNLTDLKISGVDTPISVYSLQDNTNLLSLESNYRVGFFFSLFAIVITAFLARVLIHKRINNELSALMAYTKIAKDERKVAHFEGSIVSEFDHIGHTLEETFSELLEKEKLFQDLFNYALSPKIVWSGDGKIIRMNPAAEKAFQFDGIHIEKDFQAFQNRIAPHIKMVSTGAVLTGINIPIADMVYRWNLSSLSVDDQVHTIIGQGLDITSLVEAERQSNIARVEAEKTAKARADFMAKVSHEIRTPLNGILGISQLLKKTTDKNEQEEKIDVLCQSGEHLLAVLNDILDFSKMEQGKLKVVQNEFLFSSIASSITNIYTPLCKEKDISLEVTNHLDKSVKISSDQVRLNQILFNLLSNAVKFTHKGFIKVEFSLSTLTSKQSLLHIQVSDTGIGISESNLKTIFDPFVQSEDTSTREYGGSGLGLSIVKLLVDILGGEIEVESQEKIGTTFRIKVPVLSEHMDSSQNVASSSAKIDQLFERKMSMLLVEDNATNAFIAKAFCEKFGMVVEWVKDGTTAIETLQKNTFDLIMMDNQMPNMDGIEASRKIREELELETPIFACTADGYEQTKNAFLEAGANYVIVKPIKEESLYHALLFFKQNYVLPSIK